MADLADGSHERRVNISTRREIYVVPMLTVENVMKMLVCSRSTAYEHMNRALGRTERPGNLLRVPLDVFESYIRNTLKLAGARPAESPSLARAAMVAPSSARSSSTGAPTIRVAKPPRSRR